MPRYMLDTNICIYLIKNQPEAIARRFAQCQVGDVLISAITLAELKFGLTVCRDPERERGHLDALTELLEVMPFDAAAARAYGPAREATREKKSDHLDKLIAAHALSLGAVLVTNNERDFAAYPGLAIENWLTHRSRPHRSIPQIRFSNPPLRKAGWIMRFIRSPPHRCQAIASTRRLLWASPEPRARIGCAAASLSRTAG